MRTVTLCLLLLVSASCLIGSSVSYQHRAKATTADSITFEIADLDLLIDEVDEDYVDVEAFGFIRTVRKALGKVLRTLRGINCTVKEVTEILNAATNYVDAVDGCGTAVPKDVLTIVDSVKTIISLSKSIIKFNNELCASEDTDSNAKSSWKCFVNVFKTSMKLARKINMTLKQITKLPSDTSSCFVTATNNVKESFKNFLPRVDVCVDAM